MKKLAETKTGKDRDENFCSHQRKPRKGTTLFHATDDKWKRRWQNNLEPHVQVLGAHGQSSTTVDWRHIAPPSFGRDDYRPEGAHYHYEEHRGFGLPEPQQCKGHPADTRQCLKTKRQRSDG